MRKHWPLVITFLVAGGYAVWRLAAAGWDPVSIAEIGTQFSEGDPAGTEGYDGQFTYYIAIDPNPSTVRDKLDVPAYRYQRILLSALARLISAGSVDAIPWALLAINLIAHVIGTWAVLAYLDDRGFQARYALSYGLWVGLVSSVGLHLHESLAYGLIAVAWLARSRGKASLSAILVCLALFAKETTLMFWGALLLTDMLAGRDGRSIARWILIGLVFAGWQVWLWRTFGSPGLGSGGANSTSFEWIPFMGLWRIGFESLPALALFVVIFGPTVFLPVIWGLIRSVYKLRNNRFVAENWSLLLNSLVIVFLPFSTMREPLGLLRFTTGFVLAVLIFAARNELRKPLNYTMMWIALTVVLING